MRKNSLPETAKTPTPVRDFLSKNAIGLGFFVLTVLGFLLRLSLWDTVSENAVQLLGFVRELNRGGLSEIGRNCGEYGVLYTLFLAVIGRTPANDLYEIKALSLIFDYLAAFLAIKTASAVRRTRVVTERNLLLYAVILFAPVVFCDSALLSQNQSLYTTACLACLYELIRRRYGSAMCFFGFSTALDPRSLFLLPVILVAFFSVGNAPTAASGKLPSSEKPESATSPDVRPMRASCFLLAPLVFLLCILPAVLAGGTVSDVLFRSLGTKGRYIPFGDVPNLWKLLGFSDTASGFPDLLSACGILLIAALFCVVSVILIRRRYGRAERLVLLAAWCFCAAAWLFPGTGGQCLYPACVLLAVWATLSPRDAWIAVGLHLTVLCGAVPSLFGTKTTDVRLSALLCFAFLAFLTVRLLAADGINTGSDEPRNGGNVPLPARPDPNVGTDPAERDTVDDPALAEHTASSAGTDTTEPSDLAGEESGRTKGKIVILRSTGKRFGGIPVRRLSVSFTLPSRKKNKTGKDR